MISQERKNKIIQILDVEGSVSVAALSDQLGVSRETIRRDLNAMESEGVLKRSHGGAVAVSGISSPQITPYGIPGQTSPQNDYPPFTCRYPRNLQAKKRLAKTAASLLEDRDTIFLDNSSTTLLLLDYVPRDMHLTIITNSLQVLLRATSLGMSGLSLISLAGFYNPSNFSLYGSRTIQSMSEFYPDKAFISCTGISLERQLTDVSIEEVDIKRAIIQKSKKTYLLADHTKFGTNAPFLCSDFSCIDAIITDEYPHSLPNSELIKTIHAKYNIQIITRNPELKTGGTN